MGKMLKGGLIGGGALLAGAGLPIGGAGLMSIDSLNDMDADAIKEKVKTLLSIKDDVGGAGNFFLQGGAFLPSDDRYRSWSRSIQCWFYCCGYVPRSSRLLWSK